MNIPEDKELKYTTDMIDTNFSNYSAWHNRRYSLRNPEFISFFSVKDLGLVVLAYCSMLVHEIQSCLTQFSAVRLFSKFY